jgi:hypothetical protein
MSRNPVIRGWRLEISLKFCRESRGVDEQSRDDEPEQGDLANNKPTEDIFEVHK